MMVFRLIKNLIRIFKIYKFFKNKNLRSFSLFLIFFILPFDLTLLEDNENIEMDEEEIKKKKLEEFKKNLPFWLTVFFSLIALSLFLIWFDGGSNNGSDSDFPSNIDMENIEIRKPTPQFETPKIIKTGCPQNMGRYFDLIDVKTGKKIPTEEVTEDMLFDKNLR